MSTTHRFGCKCGRCGPPEPPPMRIGQQGDTIDRAGVRRKADGTLRKFLYWHEWLALAVMAACILIPIVGALTA